MALDILKHNRTAWDMQVGFGCTFTVPVSKEEVDAARSGTWQIFLTPSKPVPRHWFGDLRGKKLLGLASGGGQQGPLLAAAGAKVTIFDNSPRQLGQDRLVAQQNGLEIGTVQGDMADLSVFPDCTFDLIVHPVSNTFVADVRPVWREALRVLKPGGALLAGFDNGLCHMVDAERLVQGQVAITHPLPCSDVAAYTEEQISTRLAAGHALEFGHTLEDQIGGQIDAGFTICGFYEDREDPEKDVLSRYSATYVATRAVKPVE